MSLPPGPMRTRWPMRRAAGFTLVELVLVLVLTGVLALFVAPRMLDSRDVYARGFHDQTLSLLRYAQKSAIAQRRTVCVSFTSSSATLAMASSAATTDCASPVADFKGPDGGAAGISAKPGISYATTPAALRFNGLGQPSASVTLQVTSAAGTVTSAISVESETGYVHD